MKVHVSPDGIRLLGLARGERQPRPFAYRWLLPRLLGPDPQAWIVTAWVSMVAVSILAGVYTQSWIAALIPFSLSGLTLQLRLPVLVDVPAMAVALAAAVSVQHGWWPLAIALALIAGMVKETSPVFASLWAWHPLLLVGLAAPAVRHLWKPGEDTLTGPAAEALAHPWQASRREHAGQWLNPMLWLLPWGPLLIGMSRPSLQVAGTLIVAYSQCLIATDSIRIYMWAWPVLLARTLEVTPRPWWGLLVVLAYANPFKGSGI